MPSIIIISVLLCIICLGSQSLNIISKGIYWSKPLEIEIKEFWRADKALAEEHASTLTTNTFETSNHPNRKSHPQAYRTSRLLDFTKKINEILDQEEKEIFDYKNAQDIEFHETGISQCIGKYYNFFKERFN